MRHTVGRMNVVSDEKAGHALSLTRRNDAPAIRILPDSADQANELPAHFATVVR